MTEHETKLTVKERVVAAARRSAERDQSHKADAGKDRWDCLPWDAARAVVRVLTFGAAKYGAHSWARVDDATERYFAALQRHLVARREGEINDPESGLPHLAHAACNALFLCALELRGKLSWVDAAPSAPSAPVAAPDWTWQGNVPPPVALPDGLWWEWDGSVKEWNALREDPNPSRGYVVESGVWYEWDDAAIVFVEHTADSPLAACRALAAALGAPQ